MHTCVHTRAEEKTASETVGMAEFDSKLLGGEGVSFSLSRKW